MDREQFITTTDYRLLDLQCDPFRPKSEYPISASSQVIDDFSICIYQKLARLVYFNVPLIIVYECAGNS